VLPPERRLTRSRDFGEVVRAGRRASRPLLTLHLSLPGSGAEHVLSLPGSGAEQDEGGPPARAGLVVSRAVGGSVVRSRVSRRLRHLLRDRLPALPDGARLVVRAAPASACADSAALGGDLDAALARLARPPRSRP
jgi:ribonuclease P protein component